MKRLVPHMLAGMVMIAAVASIACSESEQEEAESQVRSTANEIKKETKDAWASLNTDSERLVDRVQTRNDAEAKKELLDKCRSTQERIAKEDSGRGSDVNRLCDRIRDTDVNARDGWEQIKSQFRELNQQFGS